VAELVEVASGLRFPEGPIAMDDGSVVLVEIERGTLTRVSADGEVSVVADCGGGPNGAAIGPDGKVYICNNGGFSWGELEGFLVPGDKPPDYIGGRIQRVDLDSGEVETLYDSCDGAALRGPNDIVFDTAGSFYFTDLGKGHSETDTVDRGRVFYAQPDGSSITQIAARMDHPNGIGLSPGGDRLYVAETLVGRLWWWDVTGPGQISGGKTFFGSGGANLLHGFGGFQLLDSLAVDSAGNVCVATILNGGVSVVSPEGELVDFVAVPDDVLVTNICFGGPDLRTAYITSSGRGYLYKTEWPRPGLKLNF
jgi:gluconolactonase